MKKVEKWLKKGRKNCAKGYHWYIMDYGTYLLCPMCGQRKEKGNVNEMTEYNCYLVNPMKFEKAKA